MRARVFAPTLVSLSIACGEAQPPRPPSKVAEPAPREAAPLRDAAAPSPRAPIDLAAVEVSLGERRVSIRRGACVEITRKGKDEVSTFDERHERCLSVDKITSWLAEASRALDEAAIAAPGAGSTEGVRVALSAEPGALRAVTSAPARDALTKRARELADAPAAPPATDGSQPSPAGYTAVKLLGRARLPSGAEGVLEVTLTTSGAFACELVAQARDTATRETRSGVVEGDVASAIDRALAGAKAGPAPTKGVSVRAFRGKDARALDASSSSSALSALGEALSRAGGVCAAYPTREETPLDRAKRAASAGDHKEVKRLLGPEVLAGRGSDEEASLVEAACKALRDAKCLVRLGERAKKRAP